MAGGEPRGRIQFRFVATAHLVKVMCGNRQNPSPDPQIFTQVQQVRPALPQANVASVGTLDKQENHRIRCVHHDAGCFQQRLTQPKGGQQSVRQKASTGIRAAGGPSSAKTPCQVGKRTSLP